MTIELDPINEKTSQKIGISFRNEDNDLQLPDVIQYRIDCVTTGTAIKSLTAVTAAETISIPITTTENRIIDDGNDIETRRLTIISTWGTGKGYTEQIDWDVKNLSYVS